MAGYTKPRMWGVLYMCGMIDIDLGSSNGRTSVPETENIGSIPLPKAPKTKVCYYKGLLY